MTIKIHHCRKLLNQLSPAFTVQCTMYIQYFTKCFKCTVPCTCTTTCNTTMDCTVQCTAQLQYTDKVSLKFALSCFPYCTIERDLASLKGLCHEIFTSIRSCFEPIWAPDKQETLSAVCIPMRRQFPWCATVHHTAKSISTVRITPRSHLF